MQKQMLMQINSNQALVYIQHWERLLVQKKAVQYKSLAGYLSEFQILTRKNTMYSEGPLH